MMNLIGLDGARRCCGILDASSTSMEASQNRAPISPEKKRISELLSDRSWDSRSASQPVMEAPYHELIFAVNQLVAVVIFAVPSLLMNFSRHVF